MKLKLTKEQRWVVYCVILEEFECGNSTWICNSLFRAFDIDIDFYIMRTLLPELYAKKPKIIRVDKSWFDTDEKGRDKRIFILKQCIKETHP